MIESHYTVNGFQDGNFNRLKLAFGKQFHKVMKWTGVSRTNMVISKFLIQSLNFIKNKYCCKSNRKNVFYKIYL